MISAKNTMTIKKGMIFSVHLGFAELRNPSAEDAAGKTYALFIGDTVMAGEAGPGVELTSMSKKKISSIAIFMGVRGLISAHYAGMYPHWSVVVGPTYTQPVLSTTQASFAPPFAQKCSEMLHLVQFSTILART